MVSRADLDRYNTLIMVDGNYGAISGSLEKLKQWIQGGNTVVALQDAGKWLSNNDIVALHIKRYLMTLPGNAPLPAGKSTKGHR